MTSSRRELKAVGGERDAVRREVGALRETVTLRETRIGRLEAELTETRERLAVAPDAAEVAAQLAELEQAVAAARDRGRRPRRRARHGHAPTPRPCGRSWRRCARS